MTVTETTESNAAKRVIPWPALGLLRSVLFFALFYVYLAFEVDLRLLYHGGGLIDNFPTFYRGWDFFSGYLTYPGGLVEYGSAFLAQLFYYAWAGAAVVTCQAWLISLCVDTYLKAIDAPRLRVIRFFAPIVLLAIYSQYTFHFSMTMAFLVALLGVWVFLRVAPQAPQATVPRGICFFILSVVLYVVAGGAYLLFALLCGLSEIFFRRRPRLGFSCLLLAAALPYLVGVVFYGQRILDAYCELLPWSWKVLNDEVSKLMVKAVMVLYLFLPAIVGAVGIGRFVGARLGLSSKKPVFLEPDPGKKRRKARRQAAPNEAAQPAGAPSGALRWSVESLVLVAATAGALALYHDSRQKALFQVDYGARHMMWSKVIDIGRHYPYHYLVCHAVNRALYHTGQLGDSMFSYPQDPRALLLTGKEALWQKSDACIDLGLLNEAENALTISMELFGERPGLLERLALINLAKGNVDTSRVFLDALSKVPFWSARAQDYLTRLQNDPNLSGDKDVQALRAVMLRQDSVRSTDSLSQLLTENPRNRMAYEYGMAWLLMTKNLVGFAETFNTYHPMNASRIPRHYEEAILLSKALGKGTVDLHGQSVGRVAVDRLGAFMTALRPFGADVKRARAALKDGFGDSYYYYFFFSGVGAQ